MLSGCASIVRSIEVPPVDMLPVSASLIQVPAGGTSSSSWPWRAHERGGRVVDLDPRQHLLVAEAAPRVAVRGLDELAHGVLAVARHGRRHPLGDRGDLAADHEHAVVVAGHVGLDDDIAPAALALRGREGGADVVLGAQVQGDAAAVVAVERLHDARVAESAGCGHGRVRVGDDRRPRHGQPGRVEQPVREALVGRDVHRDATRLRRHRGADPLLAAALARAGRGCGGRAGCTGCRG